MLSNWVGLPCALTLLQERLRMPSSKQIGVKSMMHHSKRHIVALITCFIVVFSIAVSAQVLKGSISGTASDPEGAVIS